MLSCSGCWQPGGLLKQSPRWSRTPRMLMSVLSFVWCNTANKWLAIAPMLMRSCKGANPVNHRLVIDNQYRLQLLPNTQPEP